MEGRDAGAGDDQLRKGAQERQPSAAESWGSLPWMWRHAKKVVVGVIGGTVVLIGIALLILPGPGLVTIILGLAILATQFAFAAKWLRMAKKRAKAMAQYAQMRTIIKQDATKRSEPSDDKRIEEG